MLQLMALKLAAGCHLQMQARVKLSAQSTSIAYPV
jgi:hypothetical protein